MRQVLFWIPVKTGWTPDGIPLYGFGTMLFLSFVLSMWIIGRRATREGVDKDKLFDHAIWVFFAGIVGARIVFMIQYKRPWSEFYKFWEGGIVFYGSAIGGWIGYWIAWKVSYHRYKVPTMKLADIVAPAVCVGLMVGRIGCFLNGCCYGQICTENGVCYPTLPAPARELVVNQGFQTAAGFVINEAEYTFRGEDAPPRVGAVDPNSPASRVGGLKPNDLIVRVNGEDINSVFQLRQHMGHLLPRGEHALSLVVQRPGEKEPRPLAPFVPRTLPMQPTQIYETISMALLLFLLLAFYPYRRHYGQVFVVLMLGYAIHRFFNESLRNDTDAVLLNLTLSQVGSVAVLGAGIALELYLRLTSPKLSESATNKADEPSAQNHAKTV